MLGMIGEKHCGTWNNSVLSGGTRRHKDTTGGEARQTEKHSFQLRVRYWSKVDHTSEPDGSNSFVFGL